MSYTTELIINGEVQFSKKLTKAQIILLQNAVADVLNDEF